MSQNTNTELYMNSKFQIVKGVNQQFLEKCKTLISHRDNNEWSYM